MDYLVTTFRLPRELYEQLRRVAQYEQRSISGQVIVFLRDALKGYRQEHPDVLESDQPE